MSINNSSRISLHSHAETGMYGVMLPHSSRVLFDLEIDSKIKKTQKQIEHLSNAQSHRNTQGGKRFRARKISLHNQVELFCKRLTVLTLAKEIVINLNNPNPECKNYAEKYIKKAFSDHEVIKYPSARVSRVNDICLEMGYFCKDNRETFECVAKIVRKEITALTTDEKEIKNLYEYANKIIQIGRNYL
jgi:hypothetical protein